MESFEQEQLSPEGLKKIHTSIEHCKKQTKILEDRSVVFATKHGTAQIKIHKGKLRPENLDHCVFGIFEDEYDVNVIILCQKDVDQKDSKIFLDKLMEMAKRSRFIPFLLCGLIHHPASSTRYWLKDGWDFTPVIKRDYGSHLSMRTEFNKDLQSALRELTYTLKDKLETIHWHKEYEKKHERPAKA